MNSDFKVTHFLFSFSLKGGGGGCLDRGAYILIHKINSNCIFFITDNKRECVNPANGQLKAILGSLQNIKFK